MPANFVLLEKITVGAAGASSVTFSGIPQTGYTDLVIKASTRGSSAGVYNTVAIQFNGSTSGYTFRVVEGTGSSAYSEVASPAYGIGGQGAGNGATANTFGNVEFYIPNYTSSNNKSFSADGVGENNATTAYATLAANIWANTAAITSITLYTGGANTWLANSTFYLYGVAKLGTTPAIVPYATGGDTIMTDGTYWYHTFLSSGTFTPAKAITCDYLVVAGGGGGGARYGGGGGAGGLRSTVTATGGGGSLETPLSLGTSAYTVTIGAGGAGGIATSENKGLQGSNSVFATITSTGGGLGGGTLGNAAGGTGGSGGGGSGAGTTNQGYAGGSSADSPSNYGRGGGGGAGAAGTNGATNQGGNGGNGVAVSISGSSVTYAGGGGGGVYGAAAVGVGGTGGGGTAGVYGTESAGANGTANTGGGGGGANNGTASGTASDFKAGGTGGSGIVIIRYAV